MNKENLESNCKYFTIERSELGDDWVIADKKGLRILNKVSKTTWSLGDISTIKKGATSGNRKIFTISKDMAIEYNFEMEILKTSINSRDIHRYYLEDSLKYLIYVDQDTNIKNYPNIYKYLTSHKKELSDRNEVKNGAYPWFRLERPREKFVYNAPDKIIVPYRAVENKFAYDNNQGFNDGGGSYAIVIKDNIEISIKYILGILNSTLLNWYYGFIGKPKGTSREYFNEPLSKIPIREIDFSKMSEKANHDKMVELVDMMLGLQKKYHSATIETEKNLFKKQIDIVDKQIDQLVYQLYGLTDEEINIVEEDIGD
jgi:hypothetical protein